MFKWYFKLLPNQLYWIFKQLKQEEKIGYSTLKDFSSNRQSK